MTDRPKRSGRPAAGRELSLDQVLDVGLELLEELGPQGFGGRALARQLGITPMSVAYHVGDQRNLMRLLVERVHAEPSRQRSGHPRQESRRCWGSTWPGSAAIRR